MLLLCSSCVEGNRTGTVVEWLYSVVHTVARHRKSFTLHADTPVLVFLPPKRMVFEYLVARTVHCLSTFLQALVYDPTEKHPCVTLHALPHELCDVMCISPPISSVGCVLFCTALCSLV
jgi:hypothetical protein